jgi:hypothetical protein
MAVIQFKNPDTAKLFETDFENDVLLEVGCQCNNGQGYKGFLSDISPMAATELVIQQSNLVRPKPAPKAQNAKSNIP